MNADLERQLAEMGPEYRAVVARLTAAYAPLEAAVPEVADPVRRGRVFGWSFAYLVAASLMALVGFGVVFRSGSPAVAPAAPASEYALAQQRTDAAIREMIRTQRPDGSWRNDFLTRQNAAALRTCSSGEARVAYKKAMRNLRMRGIL